MMTVNKYGFITPDIIEKPVDWRTVPIRKNWMNIWSTIWIIDIIVEGRRYEAYCKTKKECIAKVKKRMIKDV